MSGTQLTGIVSTTLYSNFALEHTKKILKARAQALQCYRAVVEL